MNESTNEPGVYRLNVGDAFYIGSTSDLKRRFFDHQTRLRNGEHPNSALQQAFDALPEADKVITMTLIKALRRKPNEPDEDFRRRLRLNEQWAVDEFFGSPGCCNRSTSAFHNADQSEMMKARWRDPEYRERMMTIVAKRDYAVSPETREKMAAAKRGARNAKARPCWVERNGERVTFSCVSEAAQRLGVKQQTVDLWMKGKCPWPGTGQRTNYPHLVGITGGFLPDNEFVGKSA